MSASESFKPTFFRADLFYTRLDSYLRSVSHYAVMCRNGSCNKYYNEYYSNLYEIFVICIRFIDKNLRKDIKKDFDDIKKKMNGRMKEDDPEKIFMKLEDIYIKLKIEIGFLELPITKIKNIDSIMKERLK